MEWNLKGEKYEYRKINVPAKVTAKQKCLLPAYFVFGCWIAMIITLKVSIVLGKQISYCFLCSLDSETEHLSTTCFISGFMFVATTKKKSTFNICEYFYN